MLAACTKTLDASSVEGAFAEAIEKQTGAGVSSVACPDDVEAKAGATFRCTATGDDGTRVEIDVTQQDDEGNVAFDEPLLHTTETEQSLADRLGESATVDCPDLVLVRQGRPITCTARTSQGQRRVELTPVDDSGNFDVDVEPAG